VAEYFVDPENGNDANSGLSTALPWKLIPGQTGANAVLAGDIINVKSGTISRSRLVLPANNLTYRAYGISSNKLRVTISSNCTKQENIVSREFGTHEGMWTLDGSSDPASIGVTGYLSFTVRSGCVIEDCEIIAPQAETTVSMGTSTSTAIGCTLRRSHVVGSASTGITCYSRSITIQDCVVRDCNDDGITIGASASNGDRAGYSDLIERVSIINPGKDVVTFLGDAIQTFPNGGNFQSALTLKNIYIFKPNITKQALALNDGTGGFLIQDIFIHSNDNSQAQILFTGIKGNIVVKGVRFIGGLLNNAAIRVGAESGVIFATGSTLKIQNVIVQSVTNSGFFTIGSSETAGTMDGKIYIQQNYFEGENLQNLSFSGAVSCHAGATVTFGANAELVCENNVLLQTGANPVFKLPVGGLNDTRWKFYNNAVLSSVICAEVDSTAYTTLTEFEAAHSTAQNNLSQSTFTFPQTKLLITDNPCIESGKYLGNVLDAQKTTYQSPPSIGAYEYIRPRTMRS